MKHVPEKHYTRLIGDPKRLEIYDALINKGALSLT